MMNIQFYGVVLCWFELRSVRFRCGKSVEMRGNSIWRAAMAATVLRRG